MGAVLLLSLGSFAVSLSIMGAVTQYADTVLIRTLRIQKNLNLLACKDSAALIRAKNIFVEGVIKFHDFGCEVSSGDY